MTLAEVIARIEAQCPGFATVDHVLTSPATYPLPAALVAPVRNRPDPPRIMSPGAYSQDVASVIGVYIVLERRQNGAADSGTADTFDTLTASLRAALVNWQPAGLSEPIFYAGGEMAPYDTGVFTWREDFSALFEMRLP